MNIVQKHYDYVTDAWKHIMGDNLHYGFFRNGKEDLDTASNQLIEEMAALVNISSETKMLDVGCGIGNPAFYLYQRFNPDITGISISPRGIEIANQKCNELGWNNKIRFLVADAMDNKLTNDTFDLIWQMESSLLMPDKKKLFAENYRVLKKGGELVLCDQIQIYPLSIFDIFKQKDKFAVLEGAYGLIKTETLEFYKSTLEEAGFSQILTKDISKDVINTCSLWKENAIKNKNQILKFISEEKLREFILSCEILTEFIGNKILGYGIIKAIKD